MNQINHLIPYFIKEKIKNNNTSGKFKAGVIFVDIVGFTKITETLQRHSKEGAEIISNIVNQIFTPAIKNVYKYNGFIASYAGDAFTGIFLNNTNALVHAAFDIREKLNNFKIETKFGTFTIGIKIGLSYGTIHYKIIKGEKYIYYFNGDPIIKSSILKHSKGGLILSDYSIIKNTQNIKYNKIAYNTYSLREIAEIKKTFFYNKSKYTQIEKYFIDNNIYAINHGEYRNIVSMFISFKQYNNQFFKSILDIVHKYQGYFNKIDFGDKGGIILILFGAPIAIENMKYNSLLCAYEINNCVKNKFNISLKFGLSYGTAYTGFIGSNIQSEYTAIGKSVNLAARIMNKATKGTILCDNNFINITNFEFKNLLKTSLKGFNKKINLYKIISYKKEKQIYENKLIGRDKIKSEIINYIINNKYFMQPIYIEGNAGIGKSHLIYEIENELKNDFNILLFHSEKHNNDSFSAIKDFLISYFNITHKQLTEDYRNFNYKYNQLLKTTKNKSIKNDLKKYKHYFEFILEIDINENKQFLQLFIENFHFAFKTFIKALSLKQPLLLHFNNINWIDEYTTKSIDILMRNIQEFRINIILSGRTNKDNKLFLLPFANIKYKTFILKKLNKNDIKQLIEQSVKDKISNEIVVFTYEKSEGNPFYAIQIIQFLKEKKFIIKKHKYVFKDNRKIDIDIGAVILHKFDSLNNKIKIILKAASIIGKEFHLSVLEKIVNEKNVKKLLKQAEDNLIIDSTGDVLYVFKHTLIKEAIYNTVLKEDSKHFHTLAAKSYIEIINKKQYVNLGLKKEDVWGIIGYHYDMAENPKAQSFLLKAAEYNKTMYYYKETVMFYETALKYSKNTIKGKIIINMIEPLIALGKIDSAINYAEILNNIGEKYNNKLFIAIAKHKLAILYGNFKLQYKKTLKLCNESLILYRDIKNKKGIADIYSIIGGVYQAFNDYKNAIAYLEKAVKLSNKISYTERLLISKYFIALTYYSMGKYEKVLNIIEYLENNTQSYNDLENLARAKQLKAWIMTNQGKINLAENLINEALEITEMIGHRVLYSNLLNDIASMYRNNKEYNKAIEYYLKGVEFEKDSNTFANIDVFYNNVATVYYLSGNLLKTIEYFLKALDIVKSINDIKRIGIYSGNIGEVFLYKGDLEKSEKYLKDAIKIEKKINYLKGYIANLGYLANTEKFLNKHNNALKHYNKAIKLLKEINENLQCIFQYEKAELLIRMDKTPFQLLQKCIICAKKVKNDLIAVKTKILINYLNKNIEKLNMINFENYEINADKYYYLYKLIPNKKYYKYMKKFNKLAYKQSHNYSYLERILS